MEVNHYPSEQNFLASVSDMMSGLLFVFMIVLMGFVYEAAKVKSDFEQKNKELMETKAQAALERERFIQKSHELEDIATNSVQIRAGILDKLIEELDRAADVSIDIDAGVLRLGQGFLRYSSGETKTVSQNNLQKVASVLSGVLKCHVANVRKAEVCESDARQIEAIFIEGHTDNVPLGPTLMAKSGLKDNRELSTIRAVHTFNDMVRYIPELAEFKNENGQPVISVSGYGSDRPVKGHKWSRIKPDPVNRRIDIRIIMAPFTKEDIKKIAG